jgi:hypothetical protein
VNGDFETGNTWLDTFVDAAGAFRASTTQPGWQLFCNLVADFSGNGGAVDAVVTPMSQEER